MEIEGLNGKNIKLFLFRNEFEQWKEVRSLSCTRDRERGESGLQWIIQGGSILRDEKQRQVSSHGSTVCRAGRERRKSMESNQGEMKEGGNWRGCDLSQRWRTSRTSDRIALANWNVDLKMCLHLVTQTCWGVSPTRWHLLSVLLQRDLHYRR